VEEERTNVIPLVSARETGRAQTYMHLTVVRCSWSLERGAWIVGNRRRFTLYVSRFREHVARAKCVWGL